MVKPRVEEERATMGGIAETLSQVRPNTVESNPFPGTQ